MALIGSVRSTVDPKRQRQSFLKLVYENGYHDGYYTSEPLREQAYLKDEKALAQYRFGFRIGKRERGRDIDLLA